MGHANIRDQLSPRDIFFLKLSKSKLSQKEDYFLEILKSGYPDMAVALRGLERSAKLNPHKDKWKQRAILVRQGQVTLNLLEKAINKHATYRGKK